MKECGARLRDQVRVLWKDLEGGVAHEALIDLRADVEGISIETRLLIKKDLVDPEAEGEDDG